MSKKKDKRKVRKPTVLKNGKNYLVCLDGGRDMIGQLVCFNRSTMVLEGVTTIDSIDWETHKVKGFLNLPHEVEISRARTEMIMEWTWGWPNDKRAWQSENLVESNKYLETY